MPVERTELWAEYVKCNEDPYGKACCIVAGKAMEILDRNEEIAPHDLICKAEKESNAGGLTGFMVGCVAQMIAEVHSRGEEFRKKWNTYMQIAHEGEEANKKGGVLNPALIEMDIP